MKHEVQYPAPPRPRRPSRLGMTLTFALLFGLLAWRWAVPGAALWLDALLLAAAGVVLIVVRAHVRGRSERPHGGAKPGGGK